MGLGSGKKERGKEGVGKRERDNREEEWRKRGTCRRDGIMEGWSLGEWERRQGAKRQ